MKLREHSALELGRMLQDRQVSSPELVQAALDEIGRTEPEIHAFVSVLEDRALDRAAAVQKRLDAGEVLSPLAGVPMAVKDNICLEGAPTTCGSRMLEGFIPPYSATAAQRLEEAGAVVLGKLNMDEFAMGGSTETSFFGPTKNPWDKGRVPGGSSGGAAAAVAAGQVSWTLGSDTGGSIRQPCSFCGISGIKPTYGAVSRYGLVAYASSLDQIGPMGRTVEDCAAALSLVAGFDAKDSTSVQREPLDFGGSFAGDCKGLAVGIPVNLLGEGLDSGVREAVLAAANTLESLGAELVELELPLGEYAVPAYYVIACAEASSNLSRYDGVKYGFRADAQDLGELYTRTRAQGFGAEVKRRIMLGSFVLSSGYFDAYYKKGLQARGLIQQAYFDAFTRCDMLLSPVAPTTAYRLGEKLDDPLAMYLGDVYTVGVNLAGIPAVSVPCGFDGGGLPIGMQLMGRPWEEPVLVRAAHAYQTATDYHVRQPEMENGKGGEGR